jgi:hypothetical protein
MRFVPAGAAHDSEHGGEHLWMGRAAGGCCSADALRYVRGEKVLGAGSAGYDAARISFLRT